MPRAWEAMGSLPWGLGKEITDILVSHAGLIWILVQGIEPSDQRPKILGHLASRASATMYTEKVMEEELDAGKHR